MVHFETYVLIYVSDLYRASPCINPIVLADHTNFLYTSKNMKTLFETMNIGLISISKWLKTNKLSMNIEKTSSVLLNPLRGKSVPLKRP